MHLFHSFILGNVLRALVVHLLTIDHRNITLFTCFCFTSYQVFSGIAPSILGDLADQSGRRPVCLIAFTLYFSANLGLALQNSYIALVMLRCI